MQDVNKGKLDARYMETICTIFCVFFFFTSIKKCRGWYPEYNYALKKIFFLILKFLFMEHLPYAGHCAKLCT